MDGLPAVRFWERLLETLSSKPAKGNLERHTRERVILSHSHSDNRSTNLKNAQSRFGLVVSESEFGSFYFDRNTCEQQFNVRIF